MKKTKLFKSLLVAAGLLVGASAWAQTTLYERGTTNAWATTDVAEGAWSAGTIGTTGLEVTNGVASSITITPVSDTSTLTWTATWNPGNATGTADNTNAYISFGDVKFAFYGSSWFTKVTIGSTTTQLNGGGTTRGRDYKITVTINQNTNEVSYEFDDNGTKITGSGTTASAGNFKTLTHGLGGKAPSWTNTATLKAVEITEKENTAQVASYTVQYLCGETTVKESVTRSGEVGASISLQASDTETLFNSDKSIKYVYSSDDASEKTIATDNSTVVTVNYEAKAKIGYTVKAVLADETELGTIASVEGFEGETLEVFWSKYVKFDDKWYVANAPFYQGSITAAGSKTVTYELSDIDYFIECENMNGVRTDRWVLETSENNSGYRKIRQNSYYRTIYTDVFADGGTYKLVLPYNNSNSSNSTSTIQARTAGGETTDLAEFTTQGGNHTYSTIVTIPAGCSLAIYYAGDGNSNARMDYLTLKKINTMSIVGDFSANGWDATKGIAMTQSTDNPTVWTAVVKDYNVYSSKMSFEYKAVANGNWNDYELGNPNATNTDKNQEYNFNYDGAGQGRYTLTFTANLTENTVELAIEKQKTGEVFFVNTSDWDAPYIWVWDANNSNYNYTGGTWPGVAMTKTEEQQGGHDVYTWSTYDITGAPTNIIFSNNGSNQTSDLAFVDGATYRADGTSTVTKTITAAGYATYCSASALDFTGTGLTAYIAKKDADNKVTFTAVTKVPANTGLLLKGEAGEYTISTTTEATEDVTGNVLVGVTAEATAAVGSFVLMNGSEGVGFYKTTKEFTVGANTAYIPALASTARFIGFNFGDNTTTAIEGVATVKMESNEIYNLQGQRVSAARKGLYIVNGKKVLVK